MPAPEKKFLIIQTASIGDVILASSVLEKLHQRFPEACIDMMVKKGCDGLFTSHPFLGKLYIWNKSKGKYGNLQKILKEIRRRKYDYVINLHRFASSGFLTAFSGAKIKIGFRNNPFSMFFNFRVKHQIGTKYATHEVDRNNALLSSFADGPAGKVRLYPGQGDFDKVSVYKSVPYISLAPLSLWFTKQYPEERWMELIRKIPPDMNVYLLGSEKDKPILNNFAQKAERSNVHNLAGQLSLLETAALIRDAVMNFSNDSAPLHLASAMNAPVTAIFCSTVPEFGFGPLSEDSMVIETEQLLSCRPCGIHGRNKCPEHTMACAYSISADKLFERIKP